MVSDRDRAETKVLLREHDVLIEERLGLYRERVALFRSIVSASSMFVNDATTASERWTSTSS